MDFYPFVCFTSPDPMMERTSHVLIPNNMTRPHLSRTTGFIYLLEQVVRKKTRWNTFVGQRAVHTLSFTEQIVIIFAKDPFQHPTFLPFQYVYITYPKQKKFLSYLQLPSYVCALIPHYHSWMNGTQFMFTLLVEQIISTLQKDMFNVNHADHQVHLNSV